MGPPALVVLRERFFCYSEEMSVLNSCCIFTGSIGHFLEHDNVSAIVEKFGIMLRQSALAQYGVFLEFSVLKALAPVNETVFFVNSVSPGVSRMILKRQELLVTGYVPAQRQFLRFRGEQSLENT